MFGSLFRRRPVWALLVDEPDDEPEEGQPGQPATDPPELEDEPEPEEWRESRDAHPSGGVASWR